MKIDYAIEKLLPGEISQTLSLTKSNKTIEFEVVILGRRLMISIWKP